MTALVVLAKSPRAGWSKTRLCPPCTSEQAAGLAEAALIDTLAAVAATPVERRVLVLDGPAGPWLLPGVEVIPQRGRGLDERLAAAFVDTGGPAVLIGMDTPQVVPLLLAEALDRLNGGEAVLGPARDGGWWLLGLRRPDPAALLGVPMSTPHTWVAQRRRLTDLGLRVVDMPVLRDVDDIEDARAVAAAAPATRFAAALAATGSPPISSDPTGPASSRPSG